jgi:2-polyprenyl-3-methyl-5-hydroxy-6-metoxy-1,4-benzoquinol methylase
VDEQFILSPEEERKRYIHHNNSITNEGYVRMFEDFLSDAIEKEFKTTEKILDFGCGPNPVFAEIMRKKGKTVDFYDPYYYPNADIFLEKYSLITSTEVFEHIQYPMETLRKLYHIMNDGSVLAIMTKFHSGTENFEKWWYRRDVTHISFYSSKTVEKIVELTDFELIRTDDCSFFVLGKKAQTTSLV